MEEREELVVEFEEFCFEKIRRNRRIMRIRSITVPFRSGFKMIRSYAIKTHFENDPLSNGSLYKWKLLFGKKVIYDYGYCILNYNYTMSVTILSN